MSSSSQRVVSCSVAELDAALQHHITGGAVIICTSTAQEARRLLQVNWQCSSPSSLSLSLSLSQRVHTQAQNLKTSPVPRPSPSFPLFNFTASDGKLGKSLGTKLAQNFWGISWDSVPNTLSLMACHWPTCPAQLIRYGLDQYPSYMILSSHFRWCDSLAVYTRKHNRCSWLSIQWKPPFSESNRVLIVCELLSNMIIP